MAGWRVGGVVWWGGGEERRKGRKDKRKKKRARVALYEKHELTDKKLRHWLVVSVLMADGKLKFPHARGTVLSRLLFIAPANQPIMLGAYIAKTRDPEPSYFG